MKYNLEELYEMIDEELQRREVEADDDVHKESTYREGWADALRWLLETLESQDYHTPREVDDETW